MDRYVYFEDHPAVQGFSDAYAGSWTCGGTE